LENRLPEGLNLGCYEKRATYVEVCNCESTWCNAPTVFYQGTDEVCLPQTEEVRGLTKPVCGYFVNIYEYENGSMCLNEAIT
jgi:hypothetical protein